MQCQPGQPSRRPVHSHPPRHLYDRAAAPDRCHLTFVFINEVGKGLASKSSAYLLGNMAAHLQGNRCNHRQWPAISPIKARGVANNPEAFG